MSLRTGLVVVALLVSSACEPQQPRIRFWFSGDRVQNVGAQFSLAIAERTSDGAGRLVVDIEQPSNPDVVELLSDTLRYFAGPDIVRAPDAPLRFEVTPGTGAQQAIDARCLRVGTATIRGVATRLDTEEVARDMFEIRCIEPGTDAGPIGRDAGPGTGTDAGPGDDGAPDAGPSGSIPTHTELRGFKVLEDNGCIHADPYLALRFDDLTGNAVDLVIDFTLDASLSEPAFVGVDAFANISGDNSLGMRTSARFAPDQELSLAENSGAVVATQRLSGLPTVPARLDISCDGASGGCDATLTAGGTTLGTVSADAATLPPSGGQGFTITLYDPGIHLCNVEVTNR